MEFKVEFCSSVPGLSLPDFFAFLGQEVVALFVLLSVGLVLWEGL